MSKKLVGFSGDYIEIDECDICGGSQSVHKCPICGKDACWGCMEYVYDKENPSSNSIEVCKECAKDTNRFTDECPIKTCICGKEVTIYEPYVVDGDKQFHIECYLKNKEEQ